MNLTPRSRSYLQVVLCVPRVFGCQESCKLDVGIRLNDFLKGGHALGGYSSTNEYMANLNTMVQF